MMWFWNFVQKYYIYFSVALVQANLCQKHLCSDQLLDKRLFNDLPVQYIKTTSSEHVVFINCSECQNKKQSSELVVFMYWTGKSMNNLLSYSELVDPRISASDKDLPVNISFYVSYFLEWQITISVLNIWRDFWPNLMVFIFLTF